MAHRGAGGGSRGRGQPGTHASPPGSGKSQTPGRPAGVVLRPPPCGLLRAAGTAPGRSCRVRKPARYHLLRIPAGFSAAAVRSPQHAAACASAARSFPERSPGAGACRSTHLTFSRRRSGGGGFPLCHIRPESAESPYPRGRARTRLCHAGSAGVKLFPGKASCPARTWFSPRKISFGPPRQPAQLPTAGRRFSLPRLRSGRGCHGRRGRPGAGPFSPRRPGHGGGVFGRGGTCGERIWPAIRGETPR